MDILTDYASFNIKLDATHSHMKMRLAEIKFDKRWTILEVKQQMERRFGSDAHNQKLELQGASGDFICEMDNDTMTLEQYGAADGQNIHVTDLNPSLNYSEFEDLTKVDKYIMKDEDYDKLPDSFRKFRER